MPMADDDQTAQTADSAPLSDVYQSAWQDHAQRFAAASAVPVSADGYYEYLVAAGFSLSAATSLDSTQGARRAISFVLDDNGHGRRLRVYEFSNHSEAGSYHSELNTHKLAALVGNLVLAAEFPLPEPQTVAGIENALDIYVAKAQNGLIGERVALADSGRQPVRAIRNMFMLSRDSAVYSDPTTGSTPIATVREDQYIRVIDLLPNFLKVKLLTGEVGFVPERAVE